MRLLKLLLLASSLLAAAAGTLDAQVYSDTALQNSSGNYARVVPFALVTLCAPSDTNTPCVTKVNTYTDQTLTTLCAQSANPNGAPTGGTNCNNPGTADANGNYTAFLQPGIYRVCTYAQNYFCFLKQLGGVTLTSPQLGDTIRYNVNGDSSWDPVNA